MDTCGLFHSQLSFRVVLLKINPPLLSSSTQYTSRKISFFFTQIIPEKLPITHVSLYPPSPVSKKQVGDANVAFLLSSSTLYPSPRHNSVFYYRNRLSGIRR